MRKLLLSCLLLFLFTSNSLAQEWIELGKQSSFRYNNNANQHYGESVSVDGDYAVVGGHHFFNSPGNAYVLFFNGANWEKIAKLTPSYRNTYKFGCSVSISGDIIVIGAYDTFTSGENSGAVFVYKKPVTGWEDMTETAMLLASDRANQDYFGSSVRIKGDNIVVGAYGDDDNGEQSGSVYVFSKPTDGWKDIEETAKLKPTDGASNDDFGRSVAISEDYIIVGANGCDVNGNKSGSAYIFEKPIDGWKDISETAKLSTTDGVDGDYFGYSIDISGDYIVVGAYRDDDNGEESGSAYLYKKPASGWTDKTEDAKLLPSDGDLDEAFGYSVSISGDNIVVGAYWDNENGNKSGSAYIFEKPITGWENMTETAKFLASDGAALDNFASSVFISEDNVFIGASENDGSEYNSGCVYIFKKPVGGWENSTETFRTYPVAFSNEFNDYGKVSIDGNYCVVGSPHVKNGEGCAYVFYFNGTSWIQKGILTAYNGREDDNFGHSVSISDDIIVIGAKYGDVNHDNSGSVYVFKKPAGGWKSMTESAELTSSASATNQWFGSSVAVYGDNIVVGAYGDNSVFVFEKPESGWADMTESVKLTASDGNTDDLFGYSVDIFDTEIIVGAYNNDNKGSAYVYTKPESGWIDITEAAKLEASDGLLDDYFGYSVSISEDVIVVGAYGDDDFGNNSGSAYIFEKPKNGWINSNETMKINASDGKVEDYFGHSVSVAGSHMIIGASGDDDLGNESGSVYVYEKLANGWVNDTETFKLTASDGSENGKLGSYLDVSNEIFVVAAPWNNDVFTNQGSVYLFKCNKYFNVSDVEVCSEDDATFILESNNVLGQITYQWQVKNNDNWENLTDETNDTLIIRNVALGLSNNKYRCIIFGADTDTSEVATLSIKPSYYIYEDVIVCEGESYTFPDGATENNITTQIVHVSNLQTILSCDSIIETKVNVIPPNKHADTVSICYGSSFTFHDGTTQDSITSQLTHENIFVSVLGCDSIISTTVIVNPDYDLKETVSINGGENYIFPDGTIQNNIDSKVVHKSYLKSVAGCDSIIETIVYPSYLSPATPFTRYLKYNKGLSTGYGTSVIETGNNELFIVGINGRSGDYTNHGSMYLIKTDSLGNEIWSKIYNENYVTYGLQGLSTQDGGFVVLGRTELVDDGPWRNVLVKLSNDGDIIWTKQYGDSIYVECFYETLDNGYIMAGGSGDLVKTDEFGEIEWYKDKDDHGYNDPMDIIQLKDSTYASANKGGVSGYSKLGVEEWQYDYISGGYYIDDFHSLVETTDSCIIAVGECEKTGELNVVKLETNGELVWQKLFPYQASYNFDYYARPVTITKTGDGNFYIGFKSSGMKIIKIDTDGNEIPVQFEYGEGININDIIETKDKGIVCISSLKGNSARWRYFMMMKFDNQGNRCHNYITTHTETINQGEYASFNTDATDVLFWSINNVEIPFTNTTEFSTNYIVDQDVIMCESLGCTSENWIKMRVTTNDYSYNSVLCEGEEFTYSLLNQKDGVTFQWQENTGSSWLDIYGETNDTLIIPNVTLDMDGYQYRCIISGTENDTSEVVTLTVNPTYDLTETVTINSGEDYKFPDGTVQEDITSQVVHTSNLQSVFGCDSVIETTVNVGCMAYNLSESVSVCYGGSYKFPSGMVIANITYNFLYTSNLVSSLGCDSIIETTINVKPVYNLTETITINSGDDYTFPDGTIQTNITSQVVYTSCLQSVFGCDSIIETTINIHVGCMAYNLSESVSVCYGGSHNFPDGTIQQNITSDLIYKSYLVSSLGCDSIIETTLNVINSTNSTLDISTCNSYTSPSGKILSSTGIYYDTIPNHMGCDSIITINMEINDHMETSMSATICEGESYLFFGTRLDEEGEYEYEEKSGTCSHKYLLDLDVIDKPEKPSKPDGKSKLCVNPGGEIYTTESNHATYFEWSLEPKEAGIIYDDDEFISVFWSNDFSGKAYLSAKSFNKCGESNFSDSLEIIIQPNPEADYTFERNQLEVSFINLSSDAESYQWQMGDGNSINTSETDRFSYTFKSSGTFDVVLVARSYICEDISTITQPVAVSLTTSIYDIGNELSVYPNPVNDRIYIDYDKGVFVEFYNLLGIKVLESRKTEIEVANLINGTYIALIKNDKGELIQRVKIIKE